MTGLEQRKMIVVKVAMEAAVAAGLDGLECRPKLNQPVKPRGSSFRDGS